MTRERLVVANWKMYKTAHEATAYLEELFPLIESYKEKIFLAVPYTSIASAAKLVKGTNVFIGAQNMHDAREGAFTGEIAALMLKEAGAHFVILGHSERRHLFHETDAFIQRKVIRALQDDLVPVLCVGETLVQREEGRTEEVLKEQIESCLENVPKEEISKVILAYEPVWAIGTGKVATPKIVEVAHAYCRSCLVNLFGQRLGAKIPILYGGSVKPDNVSLLMAQPEIDGVLVGGAALEPKLLAEIALRQSQKPQKEKK